MSEPTKITFNAIPNAMTALNGAADHAKLNRTDTLNRAIQFYAALTRGSLWRAFRLLLVERANVRRFAGSVVDGD